MLLLVGDTWHMSLFPWLETRVASGKNKTSVRKKSMWANTSTQKPGVTGKNSSWFVTCSTYMMVCFNHKHKCLWRGRLMSFCGSFVTFTSHYLYILSKAMMTSIQKPRLSNCMKFVIVHRSLSCRLFCGIITFIHYIVLSPTMWS